MWRGFMNVWLSSPSVVSDVSLGKSIHHCISFHSLRMISSLDSSTSLKLNAPQPNWMEVNSGKSSHHSPLTDSLSNTTREQSRKALIPHKSVFNFGKSSHHSLFTGSLSNTVQEQDSNVLLPSWMEVNSGKSNYHFSCYWFTLKHGTRTPPECITTKE